MTRLVIDHPIAADWARELFGRELFDFKRDYTSIAVVRDGGIIACGFFNEYRGHTIDIHFAALIPGTLRRDALCAAFGYPFLQLGVARLGTNVPEKNEACLRFVLHLGFRIEGRRRKAMADGSDLLVLGMMREECRYLPPKWPVIVETTNELQRSQAA